jgi:YCII-related domain/SnoaL-like domain
MAAVQTTVTTVRAWDGKPTTTDGAFADSKAPLAGFSIIEAADLDEVIRLVAGTPCARAKGAIEIRPIMAINDAGLMEEEEKVKAALADFVEAWNRHDAKAFSMLFAEDADFTNVRGMSAHGRADLETFTLALA